MPKPNYRTKNTGRGTSVRPLEETVARRTPPKDPYAITAPQDPDYRWRGAQDETPYVTLSAEDRYWPLIARGMEE